MSRLSKPTAHFKQLMLAIASQALTTKKEDYFNEKYIFSSFVYFRQIIAYAIGNVNFFYCLFGYNHNKQEFLQCCQ